LNLKGMYFKKAKTRLLGCSYPKTLNMKPSLVMNASPSVGTQFFDIIVLRHLDKILVEPLKRLLLGASVIFKTT